MGEDSNRSGDPADIFQSITTEGLGEVVNFAMGAAAGMLETTNKEGADALTGVGQAAGLGKMFGSLMNISGPGSDGAQKGNEQSGGEDQIVEKGASLGATAALTSVGVPPPASQIVGGMIGKQVAKAYGDMKNGDEGSSPMKGMGGGAKQAVDPVGVTQKVIGGLTDIMNSMSESMKGADESAEGGQSKPGGKAGPKGEGKADDAAAGVEEVIAKLMEALDQAMSAIMESIGTAIGGPVGGMAVKAGMSSKEGGGGIPKTMAPPTGGASNSLGMGGGGNPMGGGGLKPGGGMPGPGMSPKSDKEEPSKSTMKNKPKPKPPMG